MRIDRYWLFGKHVKMDGVSQASSRFSATAQVFTHHLRRSALRFYTLSSLLALRKGLMRRQPHRSQYDRLIFPSPREEDPADSLVGYSGIGRPV